MLSVELPNIGINPKKSFKISPIFSLSRSLHDLFVPLKIKRHLLIFPQSSFLPNTNPIRVGFRRAFARTDITPESEREEP